MLNKEVVLVGCSGHGLVVAEAAMLNRFIVTGYTEIEPVEYNPFDLEYLGFEGDPSFPKWAEKDSFILGVGDNRIRQRAADVITSKGKNLINVFHPSISLSRMVEIGSGNFLAKNASVSLLASIGNNCILNTGCIVEHECHIGNTVHIAPGAVLAGNVTIGDFSFIGANAVVKQGVTIGKNVIIGAGTVVLRDVPDNKIIVGNPGREI